MTEKGRKVPFSALFCHHLGQERHFWPLLIVEFTTKFSDFPGYWERLFSNSRSSLVVRCQWWSEVSGVASSVGRVRTHGHGVPTRRVQPTVWVPTAPCTHILGFHGPMGAHGTHGRPWMYQLDAMGAHGCTNWMPFVDQLDAHFGHFDHFCQKCEKHLSQSRLLSRNVKKCAKIV